jgi:Holliday junction resolvasome RuvABC endonuclease subunit
LKKFTTGKGNADKAAMLEAVSRRWRRVDDDNEADATALLYYALAELVPEVPVVTFGNEVISPETARRMSADGP